MAGCSGCPAPSPGSEPRRCIRQFGLADAAARAARTYSGGMRRRLDLAASLVGRPRILFLDEPTTGLDPRSRGELWDVLRALVWEDGVTVLLTTQYLEGPTSSPTRSPSSTRAGSSGGARPTS